MRHAMLCFLPNCQHAHTHPRAVLVTAPCSYESEQAGYEVEQEEDRGNGHGGGNGLPGYQVLAPALGDGDDDNDASG